MNRKTLALAAVLVLAAVSELALRFGIGLGHRLTYRTDADCGYTVSPNLHFTRKGIRYDTNSLAMRSAEPESPPRRFRVVLLGDSVTFGGVTQSDTFAGILSRDETAEILNCSAPGWAVANELGYLRSRGTFHADRVVLVMNPTDLTQGFNYNPPGPKSQPLCAITDAADLLLARFKTNPPPTPLSESDLVAALEDTRILCRTSGAELCIVFTPGNSRPFDTSRLPLVSRWAGLAGVRYVDLSGVLDSRHFADDIHPNAAGHRLIASHILPLVHSESESKAGGEKNGGGRLRGER